MKRSDPIPRWAEPSDVADAMNWMFQRVVSGGTGAAARLDDRPVAGKTGTSEGARDLWFIGSIPQLTTAVWFGYDNNNETKKNIPTQPTTKRRTGYPMEKMLLCLQ